MIDINIKAILAAAGKNALGACRHPVRLGIIGTNKGSRRAVKASPRQ
jgi:hypothetical protein